MLTPVATALSCCQNFWFLLPAMTRQAFSYLLSGAQITAGDKTHSVALTTKSHWITQRFGLGNPVRPALKGQAFPQMDQGDASTV